MPLARYFCDHAQIFLLLIPLPGSPAEDLMPFGLTANIIVLIYVLLLL